MCSHRFGLLIKNDPLVTSSWICNVLLPMQIVFRVVCPSCCIACWRVSLITPMHFRGCISTSFRNSVPTLICCVVFWIKLRKSIPINPDGRQLQSIRWNRTICYIFSTEYHSRFVNSFSYFTRVAICRSSFLRFAIRHFLRFAIIITSGENFSFSSTSYLNLGEL